MKKTVPDGKTDTKNEDVVNLEDYDVINEIQMSSSDKGITSMQFFFDSVCKSDSEIWDCSEVSSFRTTMILNIKIG